MLILSAVTVALGFAFFKARRWLRALRGWLAPLARFGPERAYELLVYSVLPRIADSQTRFFQHGYLRYYVMTVMATAAGAVFLGLSRLPSWDLGLVWRRFEWYELLICFGIFASGIAAILVRGRLSAVALLGIIGYSIALIFALYGAPDLAITQFLVETLLLILLVLVLYHLPASKPMSSPSARVRDMFLSALVGIAITLVVFKCLSLSPSEHLPEFFVENTPSAQGKNVVNVILVDFRALDTFGEITVLAAAALGVYGIVRFSRKRKEEK
jgi:multicomponent Na+:H+ antiporter subunit A